jgi:membrane-associated phospholipid phosphatase
VPPSGTETVARALAVAALFLVGYFGIPRWLMSRGVVGVDLSTALDHAIPYAPALAYAYALCYLQVFVPPLVAPDARLFRHAARGVAAILVTGFAIFAAFPARVRYPPLGHEAGEWILRKNALFADFGFNAFPSLHVALAVFAALSVHDTRPGLRVPIWVSTVAIAASTVLVKRHFVVDVPAGAFLGWVGYRVFLARAVASWRAVRAASGAR